MALWSFGPGVMGSFCGTPCQIFDRRNSATVDALCSSQVGRYRLLLLSFYCYFNYKRINWGEPGTPSLELPMDIMSFVLRSWRYKRIAGFESRGLFLPLRYLNPCPSLRFFGQRRQSGCKTGGVVGPGLKIGG